MNKKKSTKKKSIVDTLQAKCIHIFDVLIERAKKGIYSLTKEEILELLDAETRPYYSYVITGLSATGRVEKKVRPTGGIDLKFGKALSQTTSLNNSNLKKLGEYLNQYDFEQEELLIKEESLYNPLFKFLESTEKYTLIENRSERVSGGKWENADLVAVTTYTFEFHPGIFPKLTAFEVKPKYPDITHVQQAASYLRYSHESVLVFYDPEFRGKRTLDLITKLTDDGIFDLINSFSIGLMVAYYPKVGSKDLQFQTLKEPPTQDLHPLFVEQGLKLLLNQENLQKLRIRIKEQLNAIR